MNGLVQSCGLNKTLESREFSKIRLQLWSKKRKAERLPLDSSLLWLKGRWLVQWPQEHLFSSNCPILLYSQSETGKKKSITIKSLWMMLYTHVKNLANLTRISCLRPDQYFWFMWEKIQLLFYSLLCSSVLPESSMFKWKDWKIKDL